MLHTIQPGLVVFIDPNQFDDNWKCSLTGDYYNRRVSASHYFCCVQANGDSSIWIPLVSTDSPGNVEITSQERGGGGSSSGGWLNRSCFFNRWQIWEFAGNDISSYLDQSNASAPTNPFTVTNNGIIKILQACAQALSTSRS